MNLQQMLLSLKEKPPARIALAAAQDPHALRAVAEAAKHGIAAPILCGDRAEIERVAASIEYSLSGCEIVDAPGEARAAAQAVALVRGGRADTLMKGLLHTDVLLRAVLDKEAGLSGGGVLSHVGVLDSPILQRTILLTDAAMVMYPDLPTKAALIRNAVKVAHALGIACPKVAVLAAIEVVNPKMPATLDAAALVAMNARGQITGCMVDGPLAMDLALSPEAARQKGIASPAAGCADILLTPNIDAGNAVVKTFTVAGNCLMGGVLMGATAPVVLTSRSDSDASKLYSIACAAIACQ